jgi:hypothetical protein
MPTGYTAEVGEKDDYTFEDFVWSCARGFGALIHMRDDAHDAKIQIPEESSYYKDSVKQHEVKLAQLKQMTLTEAKAKRDAEYDDRQKYAREGIEKKRATLRRYENMLAKAEAWTPPTKEHTRLREFMIEQLQSSIKFDCDGDYYERQLKEEKLTPKQWLAEAISNEQDSLQYAIQHLKEEQERNESRADWIKQLNKSVPLPKNKGKI